MTLVLLQASQCGTEPGTEDSIFPDLTQVFALGNRHVGRCLAAGLAGGRIEANTGDFDRELKCTQRRRYVIQVWRIISARFSKI